MRCLYSIKLKKHRKGRHKSETELTKCFKEIAKTAIYGGHFLINGKIKIRIAEVEFYFHSENVRESSIHNWSMYHRGAGFDYFTLDSLAPHCSGIDITFEKKESLY